MSVDDETTPQAVDQAGARPAPDASRSPEEIRAEIDQTREQLGETVEALAEKTDVKAQAQDRIAAVKESVAEKKDEFVHRARVATPESASAGAQQVTAAVQEKPLPFATAGAFAAGALVGWLLGRR
jgi:ElaB/YqjD/DUF883 family membrane-anchored ribosome-binding protein